jgi:hypothetical protein
MQMLNLKHKLRMTALAGLGVVTLAGLTTFATPAAARQTYTRCERYGDDCRRVVCNDWGRNCRVVARWDRDRDRRYRYRSRDYSGRHYVCDRWGRDCYWVVTDRDGYYRSRDGIYLRIRIP